MAMLCSPGPTTPRGTSAGRSSSCGTPVLSPRGLAGQSFQDAVEKRRKSTALHAPRHKREPYESQRDQSAKSHALLKRKMAEKKAEQQNRVAQQLERSMTMRSNRTTAPTAAPVAANTLRNRCEVPPPLVPPNVPFSFENLLSTPELFTSPTCPGFGSPDARPSRLTLAEERNKRKREKIEGNGSQSRCEEPLIKRQTLQEKRDMWKQRRTVGAPQQGVTACSTVLPDDVDAIDEVIRSRLAGERKEVTSEWTAVQRDNLDRLLQKARQHTL